MATKYWIKFYHEALDDPKTARLPDNLWRRFFECCLLAGEAGYEDDDPQNGRLPSVADMSWRLRVDEETLSTELDALARKGLIEYRANAVLDGHWFITRFNERQRKMSKAEYMRRLRSERAGMLPDSYQTSYQSVTNGNADIDKDIDKIRLDVDIAPNGANAHTKPPTSQPEYIPEPIQELITALAGVSKTPHWPKTEQDYTDAAYCLLGYNATAADVPGFAQWWNANGYYTGRPALKTILDEWKSYTGGVKRQAQPAPAGKIQHDAVSAVRGEF